MKLNDPKFIDSELAALQNGEKRRWNEVSALLIAIQNNNYWRRYGGLTFSWFMNDLYKQIGVSRATLWRYYSAGKKYRKICETAQGHGVKYPALEDLDVGPESIEIAEKLERVMDSDEFHRLMDCLVNKKVTRAELRDKWNALKPALEGQTARKSNEPPKVNKRNPEQLRALLKGRAIQSLRENRHQWLGIRSSFYCRVATNVSSEQSFEDDGEIQGIDVDVVLAVKPSNSKPFVLHGIEVATSITSGLIAKLHEMKNYFHFTWVAVPAETAAKVKAAALARDQVSSADNELEMPRYSGQLIVADKHNIQVTHEAEKLNEPKQLDKMLMGLMMKGTGA